MSKRTKQNSVNEDRRNVSCEPSKYELKDHWVHIGLVLQVQNDAIHFEKRGDTSDVIVGEINECWWQFISTPR